MPRGLCRHRKIAGRALHDGRRRPRAGGRGQSGCRGRAGASIISPRPLQAPPLQARSDQRRWLARQAQSGQRLSEQAWGPLAALADGESAGGSRCAELRSPAEAAAAGAHAFMQAGSEPGPPNSKPAIAAALLSIQCCRAGLRRQGPLPRQAHARTMRLAGRTAGLLAALAALACFTGGATAMGRECWQLGGGGGGLYQPPPLPRSHRLPCSCWPRSSPTLV